MHRLAAALAGAVLAALALAAPAAAQVAPTRILFVGNSFTYTRPPALAYNAAAVTDLNYANFLANPEGSDPLLPQPWGGVPGIFQALAAQAGLQVDVQHSLRGGATLRGHFLNTNPAGWNLRANLAAQRWDAVVLQGNSTEAVNRAGGDFAQFSAYVSKIERWLHEGTAHTYRESQLYAGGSNALRTIPANPNADAGTQVYLYQTWARPDLTYTEGAPYAGEPLETMTADLQSAYAQAALASGRVAGVAPVGEAFLRAVQQGVAQRNPYVPQGHGVDLWWPEDRFHPSAHGAYLSALVLFGALTRIDPASFGANERAAAELHIGHPHAQRLQRVAAEQLRASGYALMTLPCLHASPKAQGARPCTRP